MTSKIDHSHSNFNWKLLPKTSGTNGFHTRDVFVIASSDRRNSWVAKLETCDTRDRKMEKAMPHIEEMAYKICKLFDWDTIPKTKLVHEFSASHKTPYSDLISEFKSKNPETPPYTFTFQRYISGKTVPQQPDYIDLASYQRAILLDMILGKMDAKGENTMIDPKTGKIFEIDNEYLGNRDYNSGVLNQWSNIKDQLIPNEIVKNILNVDEMRLKNIQSKYNQKDEQVRENWRKEAFYTVNVDVQKHTDQTWNTIASNLTLVRNILQDMVKDNELITVEKIQIEMEKHWETEDAALWG